MLDDLRNEATANEAFFGDEDTTPFDEWEEAPAPAGGHFLGMTAFQRFVLAVMLFMSLCLLGSLCLLVTQRLVPPGLY